MLDLAILGLLEERDLHGYEIRKPLREHLGLLANVSFGSIYPALTRLEKAGAVVATERVDRRSGRDRTGSPTGSLERRAGRAAGPPPHPDPGPAGQEGLPDHRRRTAPLRAARSPRAAPSDDARSFGLRLAFARHLAPQARLALLERRRAQLVQRLAESRAARRRPRRLRPLGRRSTRRRRGPRHQLARPPDRVRTRRPRQRLLNRRLSRAATSHTEGDTP